MRLSTWVLGLTSAAIAFALVALVNGTSSNRSAGTIESRPGEVDQAHMTASVELDESTMAMPQRSNDETKDPKRDDFQKPTDTKAPRRFTALDEAISRKEIREEMTRYVHGVYPLLIRDLGLTSDQQDALLSLLIEAEIAATRTYYSSGKGMHDRSNRIAAIVGESKLQQFLALERHIVEYVEVQQVGSMLQEKDVPLTPTQRDGLLRILVDVREEIGDPQPPAEDMNPRSIEFLEHTLEQMHEYQRLVLELAASVLSTKQVEHLFKRYQALSHQQAYALETQRKARADDPTNEDRLLWYPRGN